MHRFIRRAVARRPAHLHFDIAGVDVGKGRLHELARQKGVKGGGTGQIPLPA